MAAYLAKCILTYVKLLTETEPSSSGEPRLPASEENKDLGTHVSGQMYWVK